MRDASGSPLDLRSALMHFLLDTVPPFWERTPHAKSVSVPIV